ncbi:MAG TPA: hypothetical protein ENK85_03020 [Saprospiraceae bacterium]|nr:hypothetical protein [Saprospiraceae bacterium]
MDGIPLIRIPNENWDSGIITYCFFVTNSGFDGDKSRYFLVFGLWGAPFGRFWSLGRSKLLLVFGAQQAAFGLWGAASCFWGGAQQAAFGAQLLKLSEIVIPLVQRAET